MMRRIVSASHSANGNLPCIPTHLPPSYTTLQLWALCGIKWWGLVFIEHLAHICHPANCMGKFTNGPLRKTKITLSIWGESVTFTLFCTRTYYPQHKSSAKSVFKLSKTRLFEIMKWYVRNSKGWCKWPWFFTFGLAEKMPEHDKYYAKIFWRSKWFLRF